MADQFEMIQGGAKALVFISMPKRLYLCMHKNVHVCTCICMTKRVVSFYCFKVSYLIVIQVTHKRCYYM